MDLISNIKHIESKLGERTPNQPRNKPAHKNTPNVREKNQEESDSADKNHTAIDDEYLLGRNIDTTA